MFSFSYISDLFSVWYNWFSALFPSCKFLLDPALGNGREGLWLSVTCWYTKMRSSVWHLKLLANTEKLSDSGPSEDLVGLPDSLSGKTVAGFSQVETSSCIWFSIVCVGSYPQNPDLKWYTSSTRIAIYVPPFIFVAFLFSWQEVNFCYARA